MYRPVRPLILCSILGLALLGCGSEAARERADDALTLDRTAWLGNAEGWGLIGLPVEGGALTYRRASNLEAPTWLPPVLEPVARASSANGSIWTQLDEGLAFYEYGTGHLRTYDDDVPAGTQLALSLDQGRRALLIGADSASLRTVGAGQPLSFKFEVPIRKLIVADDERTLAVLESDSGAELAALNVSEGTIEARRQIGGLRDLVVTAWGREVYYLGSEQGVLYGLAIADLEEIGRLALPEGGDLVAATPSAHRLYVASGSGLYVFSRPGGRTIRRVDLPGEATDLRFGITGANLLVRLNGGERFAVLQVGIDSLLGELAGEWDEDLPVALPGGRLVNRADGQLQLYELPSLNELTRVSEDGDRLWIAVEWQPPRPREASQRRALARLTSEEAPEPKADEEDQEQAAADGELGAGYYAVVLAARSVGGVDALVSRLRSVGYPGVLDRHTDAMGVEWYRAMIGPYPTRTRGEAAARELGARYGYKPWILTIDVAEGSPDEAPENAAAEDAETDTLSERG